MSPSIPHATCHARQYHKHPSSHRASDLQLRLGPVQQNHMCNPPKPTPCHRAASPKTPATRISLPSANPTPAPATRARRTRSGLTYPPWHKGELPAVMRPLAPLGGGASTQGPGLVAVFFSPCPFLFMVTLMGEGGNVTARDSRVFFILIRAVGTRPKAGERRVSGEAVTCQCPVSEIEGTMFDPPASLRFQGLQSLEPGI